MSKYPLQIPDEVRAQAQRWADEDGLSLNKWLVQAAEHEAARRGMREYNAFLQASPEHQEDQAAWDRMIDDAEAAESGRRGAA